MQPSDLIHAFVVIESLEPVVHDETRATSPPLRRLALSLEFPRVSDVPIAMCFILDTHESLSNCVLIVIVGFEGTATSFVVTMSADPAASRQRFFAYIQGVVVGVNIPCWLAYMASILLNREKH